MGVTFYEHFLEVYDNELRKQTGSYYTPPEVVTAMVRLVDAVLRDTSRFGVAEGLASVITLMDLVTPKHPHCEFERRQWGGWRAGFIRTRRG